jgi:hypothetical protein
VCSKNVKRNKGGEVEEMVDEVVFIFCRLKIEL